jgi:hypothetical protein
MLISNYYNTGMPHFRHCRTSLATVEKNSVCIFSGAQIGHFVISLILL